jgi:hypothetical protein
MFSSRKCRLPVTAALFAIVASAANVPSASAFQPHLPILEAPEIAMTASMRDFKRDILMLTPAEARSARAGSRFARGKR